MRLLFKQRFFSWLDSYDVFDESGAAVFRVKGEISFGHKLRIYDAAGQEAGLVKQKVFCWLPQFELYAGGQYIGRIRKSGLFCARNICSTATDGAWRAIFSSGTIRSCGRTAPSSPRSANRSGTGRIHMSSTSPTRATRCPY